MSVSSVQFPGSAAVHYFHAHVQHWRGNFISIASNYCLIILIENESQKEMRGYNDRSKENAHSALIFRFSPSIFSAF